MIGIKTVRPVEHKRPERVLGDDAVKLFDARFLKVRR
jgi:hypothetical protein